MEMLKSTGYTRTMENYRIFIPEQVAKDLGFAPGELLFINPDHRQLILSKVETHLNYDDLYRDMDDLYSIKLSPSFCNRWDIEDDSQYQVYTSEGRIYLQFIQSNSSHLEQVIKDQVMYDVDVRLEEIYASLGITTGDTTPEQQLRLDTIIKELTKLYMEMIEQNRG